jgi:hypothetical protein
VLCLVQVVDNVPRGFTIAENIADLRRQVPEGYAYKAIRGVLERIVGEPATGKFRLGDGYWLLVSRDAPGWLDRILGS